MVLYMCVIMIEFRYFSLWSILYIPSCLLSCSTSHNEKVISVLIQLNPLRIMVVVFTHIGLHDDEVESECVDGNADWNVCLATQFYLLAKPVIMTNIMYVHVPI